MVIIGEVRLTPSGPIHLTRSGNAFRRAANGTFPRSGNFTCLCGLRDDMITFNHDFLTDSTRNQKYCQKCLTVANNNHEYRVLKKPGTNEEQFISPKTLDSEDGEIY